MDNFEFKRKSAYIERCNDQRLLNAVQKRREENHLNDLHKVDLCGNNMRMQNMQKSTGMINSNSFRNNSNINRTFQ